jgi:hypothetical protein
MQITIFNYITKSNVNMIKRGLISNNYNIINSAYLPFDDFIGYKNVWVTRYKNIDTLMVKLHKCLKVDKLINFNILLFNLNNTQFKGNLVSENSPVYLQGLSYDRYSLFYEGLYNSRYFIGKIRNVDSELYIHDTANKTTKKYKYPNNDIVAIIGKNTGNNHATLIINVDPSVTIMRKYNRDNGGFITYYLYRKLHPDGTLILQKLSDPPFYIFKKIDLTNGKIISQTNPVRMHTDELSEMIQLSNSEVLYKNGSIYTKLDIDTCQKSSIDISTYVKKYKIDTKITHIPTINSILLLTTPPIIFNYKTMKVKQPNMKNFISDDDRDEFDAISANNGDLYIYNRKSYKENLRKISIVDPITWTIKKQYTRSYNADIKFVLPDGRTIVESYIDENYKEVYIHDENGKKVKFLLRTDEKGKKRTFILRTDPNINVYFVNYTNELILVDYNNDYYNIYE